jgi:glutathione S-transferase
MMATCFSRRPRSLSTSRTAIRRERSLHLTEQSGGQKLQAWLNFLSSELHKGGLGPLFYTALDERAKDVFRERLRARFGFVDQHLSTREHLLGKNYSIADLGLYAMTGWAPRVGFDISGYPGLLAHHARIGDRDAVREVHRIEGPIPA